MPADDFSSFQKLNRKLMKCAADEPAFKRVPFRVYVIREVCTWHRCITHTRRSKPARTTSWASGSM